jgi:hypothetical protein
MTSSWSTRFVDGDGVEWIGPEDPDNPGIPTRGTEGTVVSIDPPDEWVVAWDSPWATAEGQANLIASPRIQG